MAYKGESGLHIALKDKVKFNKITCLHEVTEDGITYAMPFSEFHLLKKHFFQATITKDSIAQWYKELDGLSKKTITVTGNVKKEPDRFYPDVEYE